MLALTLSALGEGSGAPSATRRVFPSFSEVYAFICYIFSHGPKSLFVFIFLTLGYFSEHFKFSEE